MNIPPVTENRLSETESTSKQFIRRHDLPPETGLFIATVAIAAMLSGTWGKITALSREFMISRTFVYIPAATLKETGIAVFGSDITVPTAVEQSLPYRYMLSLRLEGCCSVEAVSAVMKRFSIENASVGSVSQYLRNTGSLLPDTIASDNDNIQSVVYLSDEIFSKNRPILITVDPVSSAIMRMELSDTGTAEDWKNHWERLENNGYFSTCPVCDEGKGLCSAHKNSLPGIVRQPDTFHAVAHQFGKQVGILENAAYKAIEKEYDCYNRPDSAKSGSVIDKRIAKYEEAVKVAEIRMELYENFVFIYKCIIDEPAVFDKEGNLRDRKKAEMNIEAALNLIEEAEITVPTAKIRRILPELLAYFNIAESVVAELRELIQNEEILRSLCSAWQWNKGRIKSKKTGVRRYCAENEQYCLESAEGLLQEEYEEIKEKVYNDLDRIVQSSALVECINSIVRPYLNTSKNNITQETLNLIMFYHNHRRYKVGKRKGKTPWEILTGKKQEKDRIDLLFDVVGEKISSPLFAG